MNVLHESLLELLRCAGCKGPLARASDLLTCQVCATTYPVVHGVPVLIDESKSVFRVDQCVASLDAEEPVHERTWKDVVRVAANSIVPKASENIAGPANIRILMEELRREHASPRVLVLGGGELGAGMEALLNAPDFLVVESDVLRGPRSNLLCDAHEIPFPDGTFDAVIAQAVLEYVLDPFHVVDEIHRVLRPRGFAYAESPFMQQVHGGPYDFFRFTHVGHRWLFRSFEEVRSGVACGPGMALSWSYRYFLRSFARGSTARGLASAVANLTSSWVTRFDRRIQDNPGAIDAASAFYFLGRRSEERLSYGDILASYRGEWKLHR